MCYVALVTVMGVLASPRAPAPHPLATISAKLAVPPRSSLPAWPPAHASTEPAVDLVTVGPGPALFHRYGHAALCLFYSHPPRSRCFNYGTANFASPPQTIGWHFIRGTARFWVAVDPWPLVRATYVGQDRSIYVQRIPLAQPQVDALVARLERDLQPGHRSYRYHHFDDNCATRLRDHLDAVTGGRLHAVGARGSGVTLRTLGRRGIADRPLLIALSTLTLGRRLDREATVWETMFLPARLRAQVARSLGAHPVRLYRRHGAPLPTSRRGAWAATCLIGIGLLLALPLALTRRIGLGERWAAGAAGLALGLLGVALWLLVVLTHVQEMRVNEVLLLLWPTDLALLGLGARHRLQYARLRLGWIGLVLALRLLGLLHQPLYAVAAIPALPFSAMVWPWRGRAERSRAERSAGVAASKERATFSAPNQ